MESINKNYDLILQVLTPTHVGAGIEKSWIEGVNYIYNHKVYVIDEKKLGLTTPVEINSWTDHISQGTASEFIKNRKRDLNSISRLIFNADQKPEGEIKTLIRTGLGQTYLPGSSIKGSIRSAIFGFLYINDNVINELIKNRSTIKDRLQDPNETLFGKIENNVMRLLRITDATFETSELFTTKTYNLMGNGGNWRGAWKFAVGTGNNREKFDKNGFVFTYEVFPEGSTSQIRLGFADRILELLGQYHSPAKPLYAEKVITTDPLNNLFKMINEHSKNYLKAEIAFYKKYANNESPDIIEKLEELLDKIPSDNTACVLHLGAGSGFHGITGDWRFPDHVSTIQNPDKNKHYKSRKIAFTPDPENDYTFYPMGFIKLYTNESWEQQQELNGQIEEKRIQARLERQAILEQEEDERKKNEEELKKPQYYKGKIKVGNGPVDAEVVESGKPNKVKLFIENNEQICNLVYASELEKGKIVQVKINQVSGEKIIQVGFLKFKL